MSGFRVGGEYVTRRDFWRLLATLRLYAVWYEIFLLVDGGTAGRTAEDDHRLSRAEWNAALPQVQAAAWRWAPYVALQSACEADFDVIDQNGGGFIDLQEFCEWIEAAEKRAGTEAGKELGVNEPIDAPGKSPRKWHIGPLEMRATTASSPRASQPQDASQQLRL